MNAQEEAERVAKAKEQRDLIDGCTNIAAAAAAMVKVMMADGLTQTQALYLAGSFLQGLAGHGEGKLLDNQDG